MVRRNVRLACALAVLSVGLSVAAAHAAVYTSEWLADLAGTPGTPGTAGTPPNAGTVIRSFSGSVTSSSPTFQRPDGSSNELTPNPPTTLASGLFNYQANTWVATVAGTVESGKP